jgi:hypothetical protein
MRKLLAIFIALFIGSVTINAQELIAKVTINADKIQGINPQLIQSLEKSITEFLNGQNFTEFIFETNERIDCSFFITIKEITNNNEIKSELQIQARRNAFNSMYYTPLFLFKDDNVNFTFTENSVISITESSFESNLSAVLTYYAYVIIGLDADSYARLGGTPFYEKAERITNLAQSTTETGWKAFESTKNKYALITNLLDESLRSFRNFFYEYHRLALDEMHISVDKGRTKIAEGMPILRASYRSRPSAIVLQIFTESKVDELLSIFEKGTASEKKIVYETLTTVSPSLSNKLEKLR